MTLCTDTLSPPSWVAMLPQKFSAATTLMRPFGVSGPELAGLAPQPARTAAARAATATARAPAARARAATVVVAARPTRGSYHKNKIQSCSCLRGAVLPAPACLPGVDVRPALAVALARLAEERLDPALAVGRVDHVVDLAIGGHVQPGAALVRRRHGLLVRRLALR